MEESTGEILYTVRLERGDVQLPVYSSGTYTVRAGVDRPDASQATGVKPVEVAADGDRK